MTVLFESWKTVFFHYWKLLENSWNVCTNADYSYRYMEYDDVIYNRLQLICVSALLVCLYLCTNNFFFS